MEYSPKSKGALLNSKNALNKTALEVSLEENCASAVVHLLAQNASKNFPSYHKHPCKNQIEELKPCAHLYLLETKTNDCQNQVKLFEQCLLQHKALKINIFETAEEIAPKIVRGLCPICTQPVNIVSIFKMDGMMHLAIARCTGSIYK